MTLKKCPCCKEMKTTKNAKLIGREMGALWFNCCTCTSTFVIVGEKSLIKKGVRHDDRTTKIAS